MISMSETTITEKQHRQKKWNRQWDTYNHPCCGRVLGSVVVVVGIGLDISDDLVEPCFQVRIGLHNFRLIQ